MATYTKETALYDTAAIAGDIEEAGTKASKYIAADSTGIMVYDGTNGAQTPSTVSAGTNNVFIDDNSVDVRTGTTTHATFGAETRIGDADGSRVEILGDRFTVYSEESVSCFNILPSDKTTTVTKTYPLNYSGVVFETSDTVNTKTLTLNSVSTDATALNVKVTKYDGTHISQIIVYKLTKTKTSIESTTMNLSYNFTSKVLTMTRPSTCTNKLIVLPRDYEISNVLVAPALVYGSTKENSSIGAFSTCLGYLNEASGDFSVAEGYEVTTTGNYSHAEGHSTLADDDYSHAEGYMTNALGKASHVEGQETTANGDYSHAEGLGTTSWGRSHAEGYNTTASGNSSHSEGVGTVASGYYSHAQNEGTCASRSAQTAIGKFNALDPEGSENYSVGKYAFIIGNGTDADNRSNALTVDWNGNVDIASGAKYKINGTALAASDVGAVPTSRTVNGKALSSNITLAASDVGAVPTSRTVNGKALSSNITLAASDVGAVPTSRTVNGKALSSNITLAASDVGAVSDVQLDGTSIKSGTIANILTTSIANVLYPIGSCYTTSTNTNPSSYLGGTWELIHKRYKSAWLSTGFTYNTTNTTNGTFVALLNGNAIEFRFIFKNKVAIKEDTMVIGVLDPESVGIAGGEHGIYVTGYSDSLNAVMLGFFDIADSGSNQLQIYDWVTKATSYPTTTGNNCDMSFVINVRPSQMVDSFCDEFVWKRTA